MTTSQLRKQIADQLKTLSDDRLLAACHFVEYLNESGDNAATAELLKIKGFQSSLRRAEKQAAQGRTVPLSKARRDV
ncbi:MAG: hypothetical protein KKE86_13990 [Planctomycetes bacterium]|nr:hypothetical protein [Planctomycetota bacterium]MBU4400432.1 hypothetical protein [Planctomycetota bacterium]MCG2682911.1 hypothetical protein [Planctomycetales bacterium]